MSENAMEIGRKKYAALRQRLVESYSQDDVKLVDKAFDYANKAHAEQKRKSGEPYIIHPVAVAEILLDLGMDAPSLCAALLHDVVEDTAATYDDIKENFGQEIADLVDGVTKISRLKVHSKEEQQNEYLRKMMMAMSKDIRVIIIKLADRVHNIRTLQYMPEEKRRLTAKETLEIYAPIAHRLGIRQFKEELEDKSIQFLDPVAYKDIQDKLAQQEPLRKEYLEGIMKRIADRVHETMPSAQIDGRIKSVHGIYRKMYMKGKSFDEIYDVYAVRIIVDTVEECYNCLGIVHDLYRSVPGRFKDYISMPKPNMYQSLHTTLIGSEGIPFEVQIRTWEMHRNAEYGVAAHWKYKLGRTDKDVDQRVVWIRQMLETQQESGNPAELAQDIKSDLIPDEVFALTPKGTVISLPEGATAIDFAYAIHSEVGNHMTGAKINGRIAPIDSQIKTGDIVEILTSKSQGKPSRDWLNIAKTSGAKSKIRSWFKRERREENIVEGKAIFESNIKKNGLKFDDETLENLLMQSAEKNHQNSIDDLFAAIGYGGLSVQRIIPFFREAYQKTKKEESQAEVRLTKPSYTEAGGVIVEGIDNCPVKLSRCCSPIPGDDIIGYITRGHGVSVHKRTCPNVPADIEHSEQPDRWIPVHWADEKPGNNYFSVTIAIYCNDRMSLLADVSTLLSNMHVNINEVKTRNLKNMMVLYFSIVVTSAEQMNSIISRLEKIKGVIRVERANG